MNYFSNILEAIGNTPLIKMNNLNKHCKCTILGKLEYFNPGGSSKDRIGIEMIENAEKEGLLKPGGTIVEPTSGNTGAGLALVAALKGYKIIFTMPDKMSMEKELLLKAYGAEVVRTPTNVDPEDERSYYKVAEKITKETEGAFCPQQYFNKNNPQAHFNTTGPEIWRDTDGKITHLVVGMGTGGTISGTAKFLKSKNKNIKVIGVDIEGSIYHHKFHNTEGTVHTYKVEGIGEDFMPGTMDLSLINDVIKVRDKESFQMTRELIKHEGWLVGSSSGAAVCGALKIADKLNENDIMVIILPDTGRNYLSTVFNDNWMKKNNLL